jgi:hypothetical protein
MLTNSLGDECRLKGESSVKSINWIIEVPSKTNIFFREIWV